MVLLTPLKILRMARLVYGFLLLIFLVAAPAWVPFDTWQARGQGLSLKESVNLALQNNRGLQANEEKLRAAEAKVGEAFSSKLPSLSLDLGYNKYYQSPAKTTISVGGVPTTTSFGIDEAANIYNYGLSLKQYLYTGGKITHQLKIAELNLRAAGEELRRAKQDLIYQVENAFFGVLRARKMLGLAEESEALARTHLDQVNKMFRAGVSTQADILRSEVRLSELEQTKIKARSGEELAENNFNNVIGRSLGDAVSLESYLIEFGIPALSYDGLLKDAYASRPDWLSFLTGKEASQNGVALARSGYYPSFILTGAYGGQNTDYPQNGVQYQQTNWNLTAAGSWSIFDGLATSARVREAEANLRAAEASEDQLKRAVALELKDAFLGLTDAKERIEGLGKAVELAKENLRIANLRYQSGVGANIEVLDAQNSLSRAENDLTGAEFDLELAKAKINKGVGKEIFPLILKTGEAPFALDGWVRWIDLEGGFVGFIADNGSHYDLLGEKALEISRAVGKDPVGKRITVRGYLRTDLLTTRMWGKLLEVSGYRWSGER